MGKPDAPEPIDPVAPLYLDQAFNSPNQYTPYGNLINTPPTLPYGTNADNLGSVPFDQIIPGSSTIELPQEIQNIFDTQTGITQESLNQAWANLQELGATDFDLNAINPDDYQFADPTIGEDYTAIRDATTQSEFDRQMALINPQQDLQEQRLRESLAGRGIPMERGQGTGQTALSNAAGTELGLQNQSRDLATQQAALYAVEQGRMETALGLDRDRALFDQLNQQNQNNIGLQQTALQQNMGNQAFLQNQIAGPLGYQQIAPPQLSNFFAPSQSDVLGSFGQYGQQQQSVYGSQMDALASLYGAGGMLGGAYIGR